MTGDCMKPWTKGESGAKSACTWSRFSLPSMQWHTHTLFCAAVRPHQKFLIRARWGGDSGAAIIPSTICEAEKARERPSDRAGGRAGASVSWRAASANSDGPIDKSIGKGKRAECLSPSSTH